MRWLKRLLARIKYRNFDDELREELAAHRAMMEEDLRARGFSPTEARRRAARRMGNTTLQREEARRVWIAPWIESLWQDARYAVRSLRHSPGIAVTVVVTLGIAIGLNVSLFAVFNAIALRAWDVDRPDEVVLLHNRPDPDRPFTNAFPYPEYEYLRDHAESLVGVVARERPRVRISDGDGTAPDFVQAAAVSGNFFDVLGIDMVLGRGFTREEDDPTSPPVVVVSHGLWLRRFGADPSVIGRTVRIGDDGLALPATIVGVTRRGFEGVEAVESTSARELFLPMSLVSRVEYDSADEAERPLERYVQLSGRLKPGVSRDEAAAELAALSRRFRDSVQLESHGFLLTGTRPINRPGEVGEEFYLGFAVFVGALLVVLLLACANVGNLQLARALTRRREIAVRLSLGAGRRRIVRQMLTEAAFLSLVAGALGIGLSRLVPEIVVYFSEDGGAGLPPLDPDGAVLAFAVGVTLLSSLLFALAPSLRATRASATLAYDARAAIDPRGRRLRSFLLAVQIALSLTLLSGASLLTRALGHVLITDLGFDAHDTAVARLTLPPELETPSTLASLIAQLDAAFEGAPLSPVAWCEIPPSWDRQADPSLLLNPVRFAGRARRTDQPETRNRIVLQRAMSAAGFDVLDLEFVAGGPYDDRQGAGQAVVNEALARVMWSGEEAVGQDIVFNDETLSVVGVVRDSYLTSVLEIAPVLHRAPTYGHMPRLLFRTDRPGAVDELRAVVQAVEPGLEVTVQPVADFIELSLGDRRFLATLAWAIGGIGMALATIGVFGVFAYAAEERRREVGVRRALGARAGDVIRVLLAANRWSVGAGLAAGLLLSAAGGFALRSYLFGLNPLDPIAYLRVVLLLALAAAFATVIPARRALHVDPAVALASE